MGIAFSTLMLAVLDDAPEGSEGATISAGQLGNTLGVALGTGIGGSIIAVTSMDEIATDAGSSLLAAGFGGGADGGDSCYRRALPQRERLPSWMRSDVNSRSARLIC